MNGDQKEKKENQTTGQEQNQQQIGTSATRDSNPPQRGYYDAFATLMRRGFKACIVRVLDERQYREDCRRFMEAEGCSYEMAQGNIDRLNADYVEWALERIEAERMGRKLDYATIDRQPVFEKLYKLVTDGNEYVAYDQRFGVKDPPFEGTDGIPYY